MKVELLHSTPLSVADMAIGKCWDKQKCEVDKERMYRVANKHKHKSTIEHLVYSFDIDGISRACLQELARHRIASYSVKSTRYTLKELSQLDGSANNVLPFMVLTGESLIDIANQNTMIELREMLKTTNISNDMVKYMIPECYKTSLVMTINARALQNFIELRTSKSALWEIQHLAHALYSALPEEHKFLFTEYVQDGSIL